MRLVQDEFDPLYGQLVQELKTKRTDVVFGGNERIRNHACSQRECNPICINSNVYLCKFGVIHVCSETRCEYYAHQLNKTCPVSGIVMEHTLVSLNTYDKNDSRTWKKESELIASGSTAPTPANVIPKKPKKKQIDNKTLLFPAEEIIVQLLYSHHRVRCNEAALQNLEENAKKAKQTYINERFKKRQLPFLSDLCRITTTVFSKELPYVIFTMNYAFIAYYKAIIMHVWQLVVKYAVPYKQKVYDPQSGIELVPRIDFDSIALAIMYAMRQGMEFEGMQALPLDEFLQDNLPRLSDLDTYFSISQNKVTRGTTLLLNVYQNAKNDGASMHEICLDVSKLPSKDQDYGVEKAGQRKKIKV